MSDSRGTGSTFTFTDGFEEALKRGSKLRAEVLGKKHVRDEVGDATSALTMSTLQALVTAYGWGTVWSRDTLTLAERSLITIGMLVALNHPSELYLHVQGALRNGVTEDKVREVAVHATAYCGFPAALDALRVIEESLQALREDDMSETGE